MHYMNEYDSFVYEEIAQENITYANCLIQIDREGRAVYQDAGRYTNLIKEYPDL